MCYYFNKIDLNLIIWKDGWLFLPVQPSLWMLTVLSVRIITGVFGPLSRKVWITSTLYSLYCCRNTCGTLWRDCSSGSRELSPTYPYPPSGQQHLTRLRAPPALFSPLSPGAAGDKNKNKALLIFTPESWHWLWWCITALIFIFRTGKLVFNWIKQLQSSLIRKQRKPRELAANVRGQDALTVIAAGKGIT